MLQSGIPPKFPIPWGNSAGSAYIRSIPQSSQIGVQNGAASLTDGFPPLTFVPETAGGVPPFGEDFNGILKQLSQWAQWFSSGGPITYDSGYAASIGGYPANTVLMSAVTPGTRWLNTVDNNATNPDAGGAGWVQDPGQIPIGTPLQSLSGTIPFGYVSASGQTIGNGSSNATQRANADTQFLFAFVWTNYPTNTVFNSSGSVVSRGVSAAADFAANRAIATPNLSGTGLMGSDSQNGTSTGFLVNVPVITGTRAVPGSLLGENLHALTSGENGTHTHSNTLTDPGHTHGLAGDPNAVSGIGSPSGGVDFAIGSKSARLVDSAVVIAPAVTGVTINNVASGSGTAHNTVQRSAMVAWNLKL